MEEPLPTAEIPGTPPPVRSRAVSLLLLLCLALAAVSLVWIYRGAPPCCRNEYAGVRLAAAGVFFYSVMWIWHARRGISSRFLECLLVAAGAHVGFLTGGFLRKGSICPICAATAGACLLLNLICRHRRRGWLTVFVPGIVAGALIVWKVMP